MLPKLHFQRFGHICRIVCCICFPLCQVFADHAFSYFRINAGGAAFQTTDGRQFAADQYYTGVDRTSSVAGGDIANTSDDVLFRSGRCSPAFGYQFPVPNGTVDVVLHFAETWFGAPGGVPGGAGKRLFHIDIEGVRKLTNYDIFAAAGGAMRAVRQTFPVTVTDGTLNIDFQTGWADMPRISAIEIIKTTVIIPTADATVDGSYPTRNFGGNNTLDVKGLGSTDAFTRHAYLKFDISALAPVVHAKLRLYGYNYQNNKVVYVHAYGVDNSGWAENSITYENAPPASTASLGSVPVSDLNKYYEIDLTSYIRSRQAAGETLVSIVLMDPDARNARIIFNNRESSRPAQLVMRTASEAAATARLSDDVFHDNPVSQLPSGIFPNPATDHFTIIPSVRHSGKISAEMVSLAGTVVQVPSQHFLAGVPSSFNLSQNAWGTGNYVLRIRSATASENLRLVIVR